jgi:hypothetical protein
MKTLDRRRRLGAIAGGLAAIAGGLSGFIGRQGAGGAFDDRYLLIGLSVGVTVGIAVLGLVKMRGADCDRN